jgi:hypothetical protein
MSQPIQYDLLKLFKRFLKSINQGTKLQRSGKRIKKESARNYLALHLLLTEFSETQKDPLRILSMNGLNKRARLGEEKYWKKFFEQFTLFLFKEKGCFDNYTATLIKLLRSLFNSLNSDLHLNIGSGN